MKHLFLFCLTFGIFYSNKTFCQDQVLKYHVTKSVTRFKLTDGKWGDWAELGTVNKTMDYKIYVNLTNDYILWISKYENQPETQHTYKILDVKFDTTLADFGFRFATFKIYDSANHVSHTWKLLFLESNAKVRYTLIDEVVAMETKYDLEDLD